jgi:serine/threonine protein kinase/Tol biopolymer transport system component
VTLTAGTRLGPYEIAAQIGAGGMGEVYRALDTNLGRQVAIKVLSGTVAHDPERLGRFEREAKALAALNHPNIAQIFGLERSNGVTAIVMELIEGPTLADRIDHGALSIDQALSIATQITEALGAAHDQGIIHRDLKPANIKLTSGGTVKLLDFGLARVGTAGAPDSLTQTPTLTREGLIVGTAGYMSPEQARGQPVDKRTDIWAFGCVLYEMLTGRAAFARDTLSDTFAAILEREPDWDALPRGTPPAVNHLLQRCLAKQPKHRLRDIADVEMLVGMPAAAAPVSSTAARWPWMIATLVGFAAAAAAAFLWLRQPGPPLEHIQFSFEAPPGTQFNNGPNALTPSPDGRFVVFGAGGSRDTSLLWLRPLDSLTARPLPGTEGGSFTFWSPDSKSLAFSAGGKLKRIAIAGGPAVTLADSDGAAVSPIGTWNADGVILFGSGDGLRRVSASGGDSTLLTKSDRDQKEGGHGYPQFLPDGKRFIYFVQSTDADVQGVYASSLESPERRQRILRTASKAFYAPPRAGYGGHLLWLQEQTLLAQRFDADELRLEAEPVPIAENIALGQIGPVRAAYAVSDAGSLVYFGGAELAQRRIVSMSRDGRSLGDVVAPDRFGSLDLSPDGTQLAFERTVQETRGATARQDLWLWDFERKLMTKLTFDNERDLYPIWSPDSRRIAFVSERSGIPQIYRKDASGAGGEERLTDGPNRKITMDWSRDGRFILYREMNEKTHMDLWALPLNGSGALKPFPVLQSEFDEGGGWFSPDGKWLAYNSNETGVSQIYVRAFPPPESGSWEKWQISQNGGQEARWRGDGREVYWVTQDGKIWAADIQANPGGLRSGTPRELFSAPIYTSTAGAFDVTPDGERFLLLLFASLAEGSIRLNVVSNWQAGLPN